MIDNLLDKLKAAQSEEEKSWLTIQQYLSDNLGEAIEAAAIPHWFTPEILSDLLNYTEDTKDKSSELWGKIQELPFVQKCFDHERRYQEHEQARELILNHLWNQDPEKFKKLSEIAAKHFEGEKNKAEESYIEWLYHLIVINAEEAVKSQKGKIEIHDGIINAWEEQAVRTNDQNLREKIKTYIETIETDKTQISRHFLNNLNNLVEMEWFIEQPDGEPRQLMLVLSFQEQPTHIPGIDKIGIQGGEVRLKNLTNAKIILDDEPRHFKLTVLSPSTEPHDRDKSDKQDASLVEETDDTQPPKNKWELRQINQSVWEIKQEEGEQNNLNGKTTTPIRIGEIRISNEKEPVFIESEFEISNRDINLKDTGSIENKKKVIYLCLIEIITGGLEKVNNDPLKENTKYIVKKLTQRLVLRPKKEPKDETYHLNSEKRTDH